MWHNCFVAWSCLKLLSDLSHIQDSKPFYTSVGQQRPQRLLLFWLSKCFDVDAPRLGKSCVSNGAFTALKTNGPKSDVCILCISCILCLANRLTTFSLWLAPSKWFSTLKTSEIALIALGGIKLWSVFWLGTFCRNARCLSVCQTNCWAFQMLCCYTPWPIGPIVDGKRPCFRCSSSSMPPRPTSEEGLASSSEKSTPARFILSPAPP